MDGDRWKVVYTPDPCNSGAGLQETGAAT